MKHWLCSCPGCGHEWDGNRDICDWCQSPGKVLSEVQTSSFAEILGPMLKHLSSRLDYRKKMH